jgi:hypothetical protein
VNTNEITLALDAEIERLHLSRSRFSGSSSALERRARRTLSQQPEGNGSQSTAQALGEAEGSEEEVGLLLGDKVMSRTSEMLPISR